MNNTPSVFDNLVGQARAVEAMKAAASGHGMSHAWLFTGPPGSGRSNAAIALAAALQCEQEGCDECHACHTVQAGTHADVTVVRTSNMVIAVKEVRELVRRAALAPVGERWQIDDRRGRRPVERAGTATRCSRRSRSRGSAPSGCSARPTVEDVLPTIRSRCRLVTLATPTAEDVAAFLVRQDDVDPGLAAYAARASQGHIGRARALARDEATRNRRREVVSIPARLTSLGACMTAAANLADVTKEEADGDHEPLSTRGRSRTSTRTYGVVERGRRPREYGPALAALESGQKSGPSDASARRRRPRPDGPGLRLPRRDHAGHRRRRALVNEEIRGDIDEIVRSSTPELNLRRIAWIFDAREQMLEFNVQPALALEAMMLALKVPEGSR